MPGYLQLYEIIKFHHNIKYYLVLTHGVRSILYYFFIYFNFVIVLQCVSLIPPLMLNISFTCFFVYCRDLSGNNIQNLAENAFSGLVNLDEL